MEGFVVLSRNWKDEIRRDTYRKFQNSNLRTVRLTRRTSRMEKAASKNGDHRRRNGGYFANRSHDITPLSQLEWQYTKLSGTSYSFPSYPASLSIKLSMLLVLLAAYDMTLNFLSLLILKNVQDLRLFCPLLSQTSWQKALEFQLRTSRTFGPSSKMMFGKHHRERRIQS